MLSVQIGSVQGITVGEFLEQADIVKNIRLGMSEDELRMQANVKRDDADLAIGDYVAHEGPLMLTYNLSDGKVAAIQVFVGLSLKGRDVAKPKAKQILREAFFRLGDAPKLYR